jgi:beta-lactamase class D
MNQFRLLLISFFVLVLSSCSVNHAKIDNSLKKYFDSSNVEGTFSLLNNQMGTITVYNMKLDTQRLSTGTSFKIAETLIGAQTGKIINTDSKISDSDANNLTLKEAFDSSSIPYFQKLAEQIGKDTMQSMLDSLSYGNKNISGTLDSFWLNNTLKISPDEQLGMLSKLYFEQLPFQKYSQEMVGSMMLQEDDSLYKLSYTTGTGIDEKNNSFGWTLGWIEENRHIYFFVTFIKTPDKTIEVKSTGIKITKSVLKDLGFFKGEK